MHLISPLANPYGGTEYRFISLFEILGDVAEVRLWAEDDPHPDFIGRVPVQRICPPSRFPRGGTLVFVGTFFFTGGWVHLSGADRIVLIHNIDQPDRLRQFYNNLVKADTPNPEVVYACDALRQVTPEIPGVVQDSPIDVARFVPAVRDERPFTVGRVSRDVGYKHHPADVEVYLRLADQGIRVRIMGGTCLDLRHDLIELLPQGAMPVEEFLQGLDCFYYRTDPSWFETFGRVTFEAMACGIPLVAEARQGFAGRMTSEVDSILLADGANPIDAILSLKEDAEFRQRIRLEARRTAERMFGPAFHDEIRRFYLRA